MSVEVVADDHPMNDVINDDVTKAEDENVPANDDSGSMLQKSALPGPGGVTVQFMWGSQTFSRTDALQEGRYIYKARGTVDGKGGLTLCYSDRNGGSWELGSDSGGCLYYFETRAETPEGLVGHRQWTRRTGGSTWLVVMQSASTGSGGWIDP